MQQQRVGNQLLNYDVRLGEKEFWNLGLPNWLRMPMMRWRHALALLQLPNLGWQVLRPLYRSREQAW